MTATPVHSCCLTDLAVGDCARIVDAAIDPESRALLQALGLTDNSRLRVCKRGEPCVVQVRATRIGISSRIARHITVIAEPADLKDRRESVAIDGRALVGAAQPGNTAPLAGAR